MAPTRDSRIVELIEAWFRRQARDLPWRLANGVSGSASGRDPYVALVSEFMLQQTQVARVQEKLPAFIDRFPSAGALAAATEQEVLAAWEGLGYYRRAKLLRRAASAIGEHHAGEVPGEVDALRALPGVGRYTAGAIASLVFQRAEPAVDGNVERVLVRIEGRDHDESPAHRLKWAWTRAAVLVAKTGDPASLNEGLIELGALLCTPRTPRCEACPVRRSCRAKRAGIQEVIPRPKPASSRPVIHHNTVLIRDSRGRRMVEQRPARGLWSSMWQAPTIESGSRPVPGSRLAEDLGLAGAKQVGLFDHATSHRLVRFAVWQGERAKTSMSHDRRFVTRAQLASLPVATPQRRILEMKNPSGRQPKLAGRGDMS